jgi:hypothetical protein
MVITRVATTVITGVIHTTEHIIIVGGPITTAATDITSTTNVITTAIKADGLM